MKPSRRQLLCSIGAVTIAGCATTSPQDEETQQVYGYGGKPVESSSRYVPSPSVESDDPLDSSTRFVPAPSIESDDETETTATVAGNETQDEEPAANESEMEWVDSDELEPYEGGNETDELEPEDDEVEDEPIAPAPGGGGGGGGGTDGGTDGDDGSEDGDENDGEDDRDVEVDDDTKYASIGYGEGGYGGYTVASATTE